MDGDGVVARTPPRYSPSRPLASITPLSLVVSSGLIWPSCLPSRAGARPVSPCKICMVGIIPRPPQTRLPRIDLRPGKGKMKNQVRSSGYMERASPRPCRLFSSPATLSFYIAFCTDRHSALAVQSRRAQFPCMYVCTYRRTRRDAEMQKCRRHARGQNCGGWMDRHYVCLQKGRHRTSRSRPPKCLCVTCDRGVGFRLFVLPLPSVRVL
ncbi:hypothetical protein B0T26DRAFT_244640 [Lasiosphaeria miniovina]|uniref:Uncharacterized protein n=1 Tax=Lasiosphaeria miniovina TaxID=1954250 RepID=A0AA40AW05_9PEZI|nr:uncharacterized protein B0T26DRAFT_244640 [Lasiosphaeria miniovina]KAK0722994.1 hypothetical protein B0T26DRAFT_244640 [Lasiosphaeria miniovina]